MQTEEIVKQAQEWVRDFFEGEASGHDWWHTYRVVELAKTIAREEKADLFVCELAALLHDMADSKFNETEADGIQKVAGWLDDKQVRKEERDHVLEIISTMSFRGGHNPPMKTIEGKVVQDADRLDAIGALGIARTFAFSGAHGHPIYVPGEQPQEAMSKEEYEKRQSSAVNHFYEKLLLLKEKLNTDYGKEIGKERHLFMVNFLEQFYLEWNGEK